MNDKDRKNKKQNIIIMIALIIMLIIGILTRREYIAHEFKQAIDRYMPNDSVNIKSDGI